MFELKAFNVQNMSTCPCSCIWLVMQFDCHPKKSVTLYPPFDMYKAKPNISSLSFPRGRSSTMACDAPRPQLLLEERLVSLLSSYRPLA